MFDTFLGLPLHPLVVHAAVVLLPLAALGVIALALVARWRERYAVLVLLSLVVAFGAALVAKESGEALERVVGSPGEHAEWGDRLPLLAGALLLVGGGWLLLEWRSREGQTRAGLRRLLSVIASLVAVGALAVTAVTGHTGAEAVWAGRDKAGSAAGADSAAGPSASPGSTPSPRATGSHSLAEVAEHKTPDSCWAAINGEVYDLTQWITGHPGGPNAIRSICGTEASVIFNNRHGSMEEPMAKLPEFRIGTLTN